MARSRVVLLALLSLLLLHSASSSTTEVSQDSISAIPPVPPKMLQWLIKNFVNISTVCSGDLMKSAKGVLAFSGMKPGEYGDSFGCKSSTEPQMQHCDIHKKVKSKTDLCSYGVPQCGIGLCLPSSCSRDDVLTIISKASMLMHLESEFEVHCNLTSYPQQDENKIGVGFIVTAAILGIVLLLAGLGTLFDYLGSIVKQSSTRIAASDDAAGNWKSSIRPVFFGSRGNSQRVSMKHNAEMGDSSLAKPLLNGDEDLESVKLDSSVSNNEDSVSISMAVTAQSEQSIALPEPTKSFEKEALGFWKSFSISHNWDRLTSTSPPQNTDVLNGIRVLSILWVVLGHSFSTSMSLGFANNLYIAHVMKRWTFQILLNATVSVDTFFFISGFLVAFLALKELKAKGKINIFLFYFHRFYRLYPVFIFAILLFVFVSPTLDTGAGPFFWRYRKEANIDGCLKNWWLNILFIQNFFDLEHMCMSHTWYLANDMQFFIISPVVFFIAYWNKYLGSILCLGFVVMGCATTWYISEDKLAYDGRGILGQYMQMGYMKDIYIKPYTRAPPYFIGMLTAIIYHNRPNTARIPVFVKSTAGLLVQLISYAIMYCVVLDTYHNEKWTKEWIFAYQSLMRTGWAIGLGMLVFLCLVGYGNVFNYVLGHRVWQPFVRMCYGVYLVHYMVILVVSYNRTGYIVYDDITFSLFFLGVAFISFAISAILCVLVEKPTMNLEAFILPNRKKNN